ncbi:DUF2239 domain-containing protein [Bacteriovorax stolpii]|uniref:DUF2239 domain-containing protein n=1 Tax=Bacteriovorax stolpii TaxID=960 RepID=A0A2K9NV45_BACTC|nr:DUF2239 family protein [Bacteriovorax stolpii]AUN98945.1 DUF2239 domain-containing protein [Bacteriovorax stolpii]TDP55532.1 hypothetical protein C8D79_0583 [Bacteriovorax stolpii]
MTIQEKITFTAFNGHTLLCQGDLSEVVLEVKKFIGKASNSSILIFSDATGKTIDFNFHGTKQEIMKRLEVYTSPGSLDSSGPGRPKLGVVSREVSLLPRHWEWLATQRGGASATLRTLVDEAIKKAANTQSIKQIQDRAYQIMMILAGDLQGYEEALRAMYKKDRKAFYKHIETWPIDVINYLIQSTKPIFEDAK